MFLSGPSSDQSLKYDLQFRFTVEQYFSVFLRKKERKGNVLLHSHLWPTANSLTETTLHTDMDKFDLFEHTWWLEGLKTKFFGFVSWLDFYFLQALLYKHVGQTEPLEGFAYTPRTRVTISEPHTCISLPDGTLSVISVTKVCFFKTTERGLIYLFQYLTEWRKCQWKTCYY